MEKEFLSKGVSSRKVGLDEVIEPSLQEMASGAAPKDVPVLTSQSEEGTNDEDHETPKEDTTAPCMSTRILSAPDFYGHAMNVMVVESDDPATYDEAMMSPNSDKWLEAMRSEMGSM